MTAITDNCFREKITELKKILSLLELSFFSRDVLSFLNTTNSPLSLSKYHDVLFSGEKFHINNKY